MAQFGARSLRRLSTVHPDLQRIAHAVIKVMDITVIDGYRGPTRQNKYFADGRSQKKYPESRHNTKPSGAIDLAPWPLDWDDIDRFRKLSLILKGAAAALDIEIEWGGDWRSFKDYPHYQLKR